VEAVTMLLLLLGIAVVIGAIVLLAYSLMASPVPRVARSRLAVGPAESSTHVVYRAFVNAVDRHLRSRSWVPLSTAELELADVRKPVGLVASWILVGTASAYAVGSLLLRDPVLGLLFALLVPVAAKAVLRLRSARRRRRFARQLDPTLRIIASALRAGQSLPSAMASVGLDAEPPMSEEMTRITNEARVGRDLVQALHESSERMQSDDLRWFAEAVEVQRDTGGNLNDIIDTVAETIRERAEIREKIHANASEGRASAWVLMGLPIVLGVVYNILKPGYLDPLLTTGGGQVALVASGVLYVVAYFWMRAIVDIKV
jgi:tight adherence protein B